MSKRSASRRLRSQRFAEVVDLAGTEAQLRVELVRLRAENAALKDQLEYKTFEVNGVQLELQTRHREVPFLMAQIEGLLLSSKFTDPVRLTLKAIQSGLRELMNWNGGQAPSLSPTTWIALAHRLGMSPIFTTRRMPAVRNQ